MKNFTKKILAVVLTLCILMSGMITAFAVEATDPAYKMLFDKNEIFRTTSISTSQEVTISFDYYLANGSIIVDDTGVSGYSTALKAGKVSSFSLTVPSSDSAHSFRFTAKSVTAELYIWNVKIAKASSEELTFENRTDRTTCEFNEISYADIPELVEKNFVLLVDTTSLADDGNANKSFWFNELGMSGYGTLPNGTYTVQFDVCPVTLAQSGSKFHFRTSSGSGASSDAGFWKPELTVGEWTTTSSTFTVTDDTTTGNHILFVYGGFKGYVDNLVILDSEGNEVAGTYTDIAGLYVPDKHVDYLTVDYFVVENEPEVELSDDYAIYQDSSAATTNYDTYFHCYDYSTYGSAEKNLPAGDYKVTMDVYAQAIGDLVYKPIKDWANADDQKYWTPTEDDLNKWVTVTYTGTTTTGANLHTIIYCQGFKGYVDNITVYSGETALYTLSFTAAENGKAGHDNNGAGVVGALPKDIADAKIPAPEVELSDDYAIYQDSSSATTNYDTYFHIYDYSTYGSAEKEVPVGEYKVTMDVYTQSIGTLAYKPITGGWSDADSQKYWTPTEADLNKWVTVTFAGTTTDIAKLHSLIYVQGFKGYVDNITVYSGETALYTLSFTESDNGKAGHETNGAGVVGVLPQDIADAKAPVVVPTTNDMLLVDTTSFDNNSHKSFWFNELGMKGYGTLPNGTYTIQFDVYPVIIPEGGNLFHYRTSSGNGPSSDTGWWKCELTAGEWTTTSNTFTVKEGTTTGNHILYVYGGFKGCVDNIKILDSNGNEVAGTYTDISGLTVPEKHVAYLTIVNELPHVHTAGDAVIENKVDATCSTVGTYDEVVYCTECNEELSRTTVTNDMLLVDTTTIDNGTANKFWFNELGMKGYGSLPNGTYTIQFDVCPVVIPEGGNLFHYRTSSGNGPSSDAGWWKGELTAGEWTTTSNTFTVKEGTSTGNHILYVYGGFKGYVDNIVILDAEGNAVAGTFTGITGLTVPEKHIQYLAIANKYEHTAAEAVRENVVVGTCQVAASYDEVVYCSVCNAELSRTTFTEEIDENNHSFTDDNDVDCNNEGCDYTRQSQEIGDVNGDFVINNKDLALLMQYINGWKVEVNEEIADTFKDGAINNKDYAVLMQYINGWDVTLG